MSRWLLSISKDIDTTAFLVNLCQCLDSLAIKRVLPDIQKKPLCSQL